MDNFSIGTARAEDVDEIWAIIRTSFRGSHSPYIATGQSGYRSYLEEMLHDENESNRRIVVAKESGRVAAFADVTLNTASPNFLSRIAVAPLYRGRGLATRLMKEIQREIGTTSQWELDVLHSNSSAHRMYRALGFRTTSTKKWIGRLIPANDALDPETNSVHSAADQAYQRYGFTRVEIQDRLASIAGTAVRCHDPGDFLDNGFLAKVRDGFPRVDRAFIISDARDSRVPILPDMFEIARSDRMIGTF
ncbi:MAG: GNAT family N-acetyltransferase [Micrococcus sp.]|nr:GNAT family N-acetyltransferase [Micrococcus sp.]